MGAATGSSAGAAATTYVQAVHRKVGARQPDVPSHGGGSGLAMWGRLRGVTAWLTIRHLALR